MEYKDDEWYVVENAELRYGAAGLGRTTIYGFETEHNWDQMEDGENQCLAGLYQKGYVEWEGTNRAVFLPPYADLVTAVNNCEYCILFTQYYPDEITRIFYLGKTYTAIVEPDGLSEENLRFICMENSRLPEFIMEEMPEDYHETDADIYEENQNPEQDEVYAKLEVFGNSNGEAPETECMVSNGLCNVWICGEERRRFVQEELENMLKVWEEKNK